MVRAQECEMAVNNNAEILGESKEKIRKLYERIVELNLELINCGVGTVELQKICFRRSVKNKADNRIFVRYPSYFVYLTVFVLCLAILFKIPVVDSLVKDLVGIRCVLPNNYFVWEATRPVTDCKICENVKDVLIFQNITKDEFAPFAYTSFPMLMKRAAMHWPAMYTFNYNFLKDLYESVDGAYESVEEECQILTFKTQFKTLREVFSMPESRVQQKTGEAPWYVGWSNCHPEVLKVLRQYYETPSFLPDEAEHALMDYIFIGYNQGAVMHIDYISRLMWQAQILGHKTWKLLPPPECDHVCTPLSFRVEPGDIVLLDTRQWYHDTSIDPGELSLTVSSEYG